MDTDPSRAVSASLQPPLQLQSKYVCVVGAGMAGMAAARELRREGHAVTVLEESADVGGQWLYDPRTDGGDLLGATVPVRVPSSMYACLRLISPREAMGFSDFQFLPRHGVAGRYPVHRELYCYLRDFCDAFGLLDAVRLNTRVLRVAVTPANQWSVTSVRLAGGGAGVEVEKQELFDAVVVATGHYSQPRLPSIKGMEGWRRRQMHSHPYRTPELFRDEVVVMVGCGDSGKDIALDLRRVAKAVHLTAKSTEEAMTPAMAKMLANHANLHLHPQVDELHADGRVAFADGSSVVADTIVYCTGYTYSFPFLDTGGAITVDDNRVGPLFEHVFPPSLAPSLSFVGIPRQVLVPWFFEAQGKWVAQVLSGRRALPPEEEMMQNGGSTASTNSGISPGIAAFREYSSTRRVVGAGMAGMAAARELQREGHAVTVMEQSGDVGGQWLYDPRTDGDDLLGATVPVRVPSSMYACLRLISPREAMGFSDFQFLPRHGVAGRDPRRYPVHRELYCYLLDAVRLNTRVLRVAVTPANQWSVTSVRLAGGGAGVEVEKQELLFDAVVVATGHYSQPRLPSIKGMEGRRRRQMHSHSYRTPEPFRDEVVVMVGCGDSGKDIALDLRRVAKAVHLTAKSTEEAMTPAMAKMLANHANLHLHPQVDELHADGSSVVADTIVYCTGYTYSFPFLDTGGAVTMDDNRVGPLFEHVFPPSLAPSLSFVGIPRQVLVPWFFEAQGKWVAQVLSGRRALPPEEEMMQSVQEYYRAREAAGIPKKYTHDICGVDPVKMYEFGEKYCDFPRIEDWQAEVMMSGVARMKEDMEKFRDCNDDSEYVRKCLQRWYALPATPAHQGEHDDDQTAVSRKDNMDGVEAEVDVQAMATLLIIN